MKTKLSDIVWWMLFGALFGLLLGMGVKRLAGEEYQSDKLRSLLPVIDDVALTKKLESKHPGLFFFEDSDFPRAYQDYFTGGPNAPGLPGVHSAWYNKAGDGSSRKLDPFGNGNREFPWGDTAGTHNVTNLYKFRFLWLPPRTIGDVGNAESIPVSRTFWPIVWYGKDQVGVGFNWVYPKGAIVGEVLCVVDPEGKGWPYEVRTRERTLTSWETEVYRPVTSAEQLRSLALEQGLTTLAAQLAKPVSTLPTVALEGQHQRNQFVAKAPVDLLPTIPPQAVKGLLERPFQALGATLWREGVGAPTTEAAFHIVPSGYEMSPILHPDGCLKCHEDTNQPVSKFSPNRDWYGQIRGSDGIFSIHPFDKSCISTDGFHRSARMNKALEANGMFAPYESVPHPGDMYKRIKDLK